MNIIHGIWVPDANSDFYQSGQFSVWVELDKVQKHIDIAIPLNVYVISSAWISTPITLAASHSGSQFVFRFQAAEKCQESPIETHHCEKNAEQIRLQIENAVKISHLRL